MIPTVSKQCEYGTAKAGCVDMERCPKEAKEEYIQLDEDDPIHLCEEHYEYFQYEDFLSKRR